MAADSEFLRAVAKVVQNDLPVRCSLVKGVETVIDHVREGDKEELFSLIFSMADKSDGLSKEQFQTMEQMEEFLALGHNLCLKDATRDGKIYCFMNMTGSPLCRSNKPAMVAGYVLAYPEYRGKGAYFRINLIQIALAVSQGFIGAQVRVLTTVAAGILSTNEKHGSVGYNGIIPDSLQTGNGRWIGDLITVSKINTLSTDVSTFMKAIGLEVEQRQTLAPLSLPPLHEGNAKLYFELLTENQGNVHETFHTLSNEYKTGKKIYVKVDSDVDLQVETWIRDAAMTGSGFGMDEFDDNGLFNRKFLRHTVTLGAFRRTDNKLVGGVVVGHSCLVRTIGISTFGGYIVIDEKHRRSGYAFDLLDICEKMAQQFRVRNIISDVLISPSGIPGFHLASRAGYTVTGQLHKCAFLKDVGLTDSLLVHKQLSSSRL